MYNLGQSGLGGLRPNKGEEFHNLRLARVSSVNELDSMGRIEVTYEKGGMPTFVYFVENVSIRPEQGDWVIVGTVDGQKNNVIFMGFYRNRYACSKYIVVTKDYIRLQIPTNDSDILNKMTDDSKLNTRVSLEMKKDSVLLKVPWEESPIFRIVP